MRRILFLALLLPMAFISHPAFAAEVGTGTIRIIERTDFCQQFTCPAFRFQSDQLDDFSVRGNQQTPLSGQFINLPAGDYTIAQEASSVYPLVDARCFSDTDSRRRDRRSNLNDAYPDPLEVFFHLDNGETVTCTFSNSPATPTATPSPVPTATLQPTATSTPMATATPSPTVPSVPPTPFVVVIQQAPPVLPTVAPVAPVVAPVRVSPPNTGTGGLLPLYWDDDGSGGAFDFGPIPPDNEWGW